MINKQNFTGNYISCLVYFPFICLKKANILSHKSQTLFEVFPVWVGKQESTSKQKKTYTFLQNQMSALLYTKRLVSQAKKKFAVILSLCLMFLGCSSN